MRGGGVRKGRRVEDRGLPLIHDKAVDEWGIAVLGYFMTGPPAQRLAAPY